MPFSKDIVIPREILNSLPNSVRIIDKKHLAGMWPVNLSHIRQLQNKLPSLFKDESVMNKFNLAITYKGKAMKTDFSKAGIDLIQDRVLPDILINGIPIPWQFLKKAGIDYRKFEIILTPK